MQLFNIMVKHSYLLRPSRHCERFQSRFARPVFLCSSSYERKLWDGTGCARAYGIGFVHLSPPDRAHRRRWMGQFDTIFRILHDTILLIFEIMEGFCVSLFKFCQIFSFVRHESIVHWNVMLVPNMGDARLVHSRESKMAAVSARFVDYLHRNICKFSARVFCHYLNLSFVPKK